MGDQEVQKPSLDVHYSEQNTPVDNLKIRRLHRRNVTIGSLRGKHPGCLAGLLLSVPRR
jgi:hypothetical protein